MALLSGCGSKTTTPGAKINTNQSSSNQQQTVNINFQHGDWVQAGKMITVPVLLNNTGTNSTVIDSKNFTLKIGTYKFKPYSLNKAVESYHVDFKPNASWTNVLSFYLGANVNKRDLSKAKLIYKQDDGKEAVASYRSEQDDDTKITDNSTNANLTIGSYYDEVKSYISDARKMARSGDDPPSLQSKFDDKNFDRVSLWIVQPANCQNKVIVKAMNQSKSDIVIDFNNIEFVDNSNNDEIRVRTDFRDYKANLYHNKFVTFVLPLDSNLKLSNRYTLYVRSGDNDFFTTENSFSPSFVNYSQHEDLRKVFSLDPSQYRDHIKWKKLGFNVNTNTLNVQVKISDYYTLDMDPRKFVLRGTTKKGKSVANVTSKDVSPDSVTSNNNTKIGIEFGDLTHVAAADKIDLYYSNKKILTIK